MNPIHARLLIVSSGTRPRQQLRELLDELHVIQVDEARDGVQALALHQERAYDLVVADWDAPRLSGIELLRAIRRGGSRSHTSVVLMSGEKLGPRTIEALQAGANGLLELPLDVARAREKLRRIIGGMPERSARGALRAADLWSPGEADRIKAGGLPG